MLTVRISQDAWQGSAQYTITVDGTQIGGVRTANASHSAGKYDTISIPGIGAGPHKVAVKFLNDAWGGTAATDRNLYVDGIYLDGVSQGVSAKLSTTGTRDFSIGTSGGQGVAYVGEQILPAGWKPDVVESFNSGKGIFSHSWGPGVDTSVKGQLTIRSTWDDKDSGAMVKPAGAEKGFGYGLYSFTVKAEGHIGPYALLWPSTDKWPGPELDVLEILSNGQPYSTVHWKNASGGDSYRSNMWNGVDETQKHTYSLLWEHGRLTGFVDGKQMWTTTSNVPKDYAHGGENLAPSLGMQTRWNNGELGGKNWITAYEFSYADMNPLG
ncbi:carbohydrate-binding domain-containing protein [Roseicella aerolata]|uniref:Family 16 glycosylhydrolase n=1 Tax=Roseicella aerolata TaxID=2883479 RepID=A0A9X1IG75_9PROT|nr:carbohydrate-binding domain-containing protein [Roseicella aerolata]MCB4823947.1 family 16 glycosylhydrolase [Roseicella aerolata]